MGIHNVEISGFYLPLRFYVKSILVILKPKNSYFIIWAAWFLNFGSCWHFLVWKSKLILQNCKNGSFWPSEISHNFRDSRLWILVNLGIEELLKCTKNQNLEPVKVPNMRFVTVWIHHNLISRNIWVATGW